MSARFPKPLLARPVLLAALLTVLATGPLLAGDVIVTRYFSGHWEQPQQESQGLILQVIDQDDGSKKAVVYWFTFGEDLGTAWFIGVGPVEGDHIDLVLYSAFGVSFMQEDFPGNEAVTEIGTLTLAFQNCNHGAAMFDTPEDAIGSGEFPIKRLSSLYRSRCSGGISDDTPSNARPTKLEVDLEPAREDVVGKGKAKFWERPDRSDFQVSAEDLPDGLYEIEVCGSAQGQLTIAGGEGEQAFRSPEAEGKPLLTFDPRDCRIDLVDALGPALSSGDDVLTAKSPGQGGGGGEGQGNLRIEVDLEDTGVIPGAEGEAEFSISGPNREFEVEIENLPAGGYPLYVDGAERGVIDVTQTGSTLRGGLKFSDPPKGTDLELDFDPRDTLVEIVGEGEVVLEAIFPGD